MKELERVAAFNGVPPYTCELCGVSSRPDEHSLHGNWFRVRSIGGTPRVVCSARSTCARRRANRASDEERFGPQAV